MSNAMKPVRRYVPLPLRAAACVKTWAKDTDDDGDSDVKVTPTIKRLPANSTLIHPRSPAMKGTGRTTQRARGMDERQGQCRIRPRCNLTSPFVILAPVGINPYPALVAGDLLCGAQRIDCFPRPLPVSWGDSERRMVIRQRPLKTNKRRLPAKFVDIVAW